MDMYYKLSLTKEGEAKNRTCRETLQYDLYASLLASRDWSERLKFPRRRVRLETGIGVDQYDLFPSLERDYRNPAPVLIPKGFLTRFAANIKQFATLLNRQICKNLGRPRSRVEILISPAAEGKSRKKIWVKADLPAYFLYNPVLASFWHGMIYHIFCYSRDEIKTLKSVKLQNFCDAVGRSNDYDQDAMPLQEQNWKELLQCFLESYEDTYFYQRFIKRLKNSKKATIYNGRFPEMPNGYLNWCEEQGNES